MEELEAENERLNAELEALRQRIQRTATANNTELARRGNDSAQHDPECENEYVDIQEYNRVKGLLAKNDKDYEKILFAHQVLKSKLRHYKDMTKQWREYTDRWILKYPKKLPKSITAPNASPTASTRDPRSSSAPAPPFIPNGMTPSVTDGSRSTSPWAEGDDLQQQHRSPPRSHIGSPKLPDRIFATQKALSSVLEPSSGDLTEGSDETEQPLGHKYTNDHERIDNDPKQNGVEDDDSPVILSERSLKRKRPISAHDGGGPRGSPVKTEITSSSPLPALAYLGTCGPHDSLDLDDVGGHIDTPRKRRRLEEMRLRSSMVASSAYPDQGRVSNDINGERCIETFIIKDEDDQPVTSSKRSLSPRSSKDVGAQDYGERQRKLSNASSRAPQQAHNKIGDANPRRSTSPSFSKYTAPALPKSPTSAYPTPTTGRRPPPHAPLDRRATEERRTGLRRSPAILQPTDLNAHILPRTNSKPPNHKLSNLSSRRDRGAAQVPALAEDGENSPSISNKPRARQSDLMMPSDKSSKVPDAHHRLGTLLNEPSPEKSLLGAQAGNPNLPRALKSMRTPVARSDPHEGPKGPSTPLSMQADIRVAERATGSKTSLKQGQGFKILSDQKSKSAQAATKQSIRNLPSREPPPADPPTDDQPEQEPLRARPLHRLRISDFKLNPAHCDYAYHESVRKHDEKQSLSGCTDRNCLRCKDIRKFVESSGYARTPGQDPEQTDQRLLLEYLGGDKRRLERLSAEERKELLLQAKTKQFADRFGKHRQHFGRAKSPVGFWEVDFPTTQEHERNGEEVGRREREKVEEMYWEAMRKGGRWVFADE